MKLEDFAQFPHTARALGLPASATSSVVAMRAQDVADCAVVAAAIADVYHRDSCEVMEFVITEPSALWSAVHASGVDALDIAMERHDLCCDVHGDTLVVARDGVEVAERIGELEAAQ